MSKHTPGPWEASDDFGGTVRGGEGEQWGIIAEVSGWTQENVIANARLIAAAPELLEACLLLLRAYDQRESIPDRWANQIRAAIRKAEEGK